MTQIMSEWGEWGRGATEAATPGAQSGEEAFLHQDFRKLPPEPAAGSSGIEGLATAA